MTSREKAAQRIVQNSAAYKICCGCESIVILRATICPHCKTYRFETEGVAAHAVQLSQRDPATWSEDEEGEAA